jgi:aspartate-semialdehyde dehydrogenase
MDGHTEAVFVSTERPASISAAREAFEDFQSGFESLGLPSAPSRLITFMEDPYRPQPRLDRDTEDGMTTTVGRLRKDHALTNGLKWVLVSHNTKNGGSKGAVLVAEMLSKKGYIGG